MPAQRRDVAQPSGGRSLGEAEVQWFRRFSSVPIETIETIAPTDANSQRSRIRPTRIRSDRTRIRSDRTRIRIPDRREFASIGREIN